MARLKTNITAEAFPITCDGTEADTQCWVRVTEMLLRARERRERRLAVARMVYRTVVTVSFTIGGAEPSRFMAAC
jgi:hypothetical protein